MIRSGSGSPYKRYVSRSHGRSTGRAYKSVRAHELRRVLVLRHRFHGAGVVCTIVIHCRLKPSSSVCAFCQTHVHVLKRFGGVANELSPARVRSRRRIRKRAASRLPRMHELAAVEQVQIVRPCMRKCSNYRRAKCRSLLSALAVHARRRMQLARLVAGWPCIHSQWCRLVCPHGHSCNV